MSFGRAGRIFIPSAERTSARPSGASLILRFAPLRCANAGYPLRPLTQNFNKKKYGSSIPKTTF